MGIKKFSKFSEETLAELRKNPYIAHVLNGYMLEFTQEFQEIAYQELLKGDKTMREILQNHGIDTEILDSSRINNFTYRLRKRKHAATNMQNVYNISQKEREVAVNSMDKTPKRVESQQDKVEVSQKPFTEEERLSLLNNQYVSGVTNDSVQFTEEFKELAYNEFRKSGKPMREIFKEHGIDPEILGSKRIWNFTSKLQEKAKKLQGFGDARTHNKRRPKCSPTEEKTLTERICSLEHELAYTRQELEFLKKTQMIDMEARISWESKHRKK